MARLPKLFTKTKRTLISILLMALLPIPALAGMIHTTANERMFRVDFTGTAPTGSMAMVLTDSNGSESYGLSYRTAHSCPEGFCYRGYLFDVALLPGSYMLDIVSTCGRWSWGGAAKILAKGLPHRTIAETSPRSASPVSAAAIPEGLPASATLLGFLALGLGRKFIR